MSARGYHIIEDDLPASLPAWLIEAREDIITGLERLLAKHAAFADYCEARERG